MSAGNSAAVNYVITLDASIAESVMSCVRPSVRLSRRHTHSDSPGKACDAASVHFGPRIRRTDIVVIINVAIRCIIRL